MSYTVGWVSRAENELADEWPHSRDLEAIMRSARLIHLRLQTDPENEAESRPRGPTNSLLATPWPPTSAFCLPSAGSFSFRYGANGNPNCLP